MGWCTRLFTVLSLCLFFCACNDDAKEFRDVLEEGSWYVTGIEYDYETFDLVTPELEDYIYFLLQENNLLFLPGEELVFSKKRIHVRTLDHQVFSYPMSYSGDYLEVDAGNGVIFSLYPSGNRDEVTLSFSNYSLERQLEELSYWDESYYFLYQAARRDPYYFSITYYLQHPLPPVAQIISGIYYGELRDGTDQLLNKDAVLNLFWANNQMNLSLEDKIILENGTQFFVEIPGLEYREGFTTGSYDFSGQQWLEDAQGNPVEISATGRFNASGSVSAEMVINYQEQVYELHYTKGIRHWARSRTSSPLPVRENRLKSSFNR